MSNAENNENQNNKNDVTNTVASVDVCEVTGVSLDDDVSIIDLREALNINDAPKEDVRGEDSADCKETKSEQTQDTAAVGLPPQGELLSVVDEAHKIAKIEPASGVEVEEDLSVVAKKLAQVEPAAGDNTGGGNVGSSDGGYGFQSGFDAQGVIPIDDVGPIDPTELKYGINNPNDELFIFEDKNPLPINSILNPILGVGDVIVKEDGVIDVPITAALAVGHSAAEFLTVTVTGIDAAWGSFSAPIGVYDSVGGIWMVTLPAGASLDTLLTFSPNADSDIDLTGLVATAVANDPVAAISASANDGFDVVVDAVADVPNLDALSASGDEGTTIPLTITTSVNDVDGSEVIEVVKISDVPTGATLTAGAYDSVNDVWLLSLADLVGLGINVPSGMVGNFTLNIESVAYEQNTNGVEVDLSDNRASAYDRIQVSVQDDSVPVIRDVEASIDETDLSPTASVSGNISANFGSDAPGLVIGNATSFIGGVTSGGASIVVGFDAATNTYTGTAGTEVIFTLIVQPNGDYRFELNGVIDHPDATDPNDSLPLEFGVTAIDSDGSEVDANITINVFDDAPIAQDDYISGSISDGNIGGNVVDNDDLSQDHDNTVTQIMFGSNIVDVPANGLDVTINGDNGVLTINSSGDYNYVPNASSFSGYVKDVFEYVLTDGDNDSDTALLKIKTYAPNESFIVGQNVDDVEGSVIPHLVNGNEAVIEGAAGNDILVGDAGGSFLEPQLQDYNFVFMLDVSNSMGDASDPDSRISILKDSVENLLNEFGAYQDGQVKVHITPFAKYLQPTGTFMVTNADELVAALSYVETLTTSGYTNYETAFNDAISWLQSGDAIGGDAITTTYFISDGVPNKYIDANGNVAYNTTGVAMDEVLGSDGTNEVALLKSLNDDVIAVGIEANASVMANLNAIDMDGAALNIDDPSDLSMVLASTNPIDGLDSVGGDVIEGGSGDDIIFGDVLFTDDVATIHGLSVDDGAGWEVFERLENGESAIDAGWDRSDTIAYIRANSESLSEESVDFNGNGRSGGDDTIRGGAGDDLIFGQEGNDIISGGAGDDILYGGSGADIFLFEAINEGVDIVKDFDAVEGDLIDLSALLTGYDELTDDIADFIIATEIGGDTVVSVDQSGNSGATSLVGMVVLEGVTGLDLDLSIKTDTF